MCRKALTWQQLISLGLKAFLHSYFSYIEFQSCKTEESQSRKWRGLTSQYRLGQMPAWLKDWHSACIHSREDGTCKHCKEQAPPFPDLVTHSACHGDVGSYNI